MADIKLTWKGKEVSDKVKSAAITGLTNAAEAVLDRSNQKVPLAEGTLANSATTSVDASSLTAAVSYDTIYAVRQHEDLSLRHLNGREAKYLENAIKEMSNEIQRYLAASLKDAIGG